MSKTTFCYLLIPIFSLFSLVVNGQEFDHIIKKALKCTKNAKLDSALVYYEEAFRLNATNKYFLLNAAMIAARLNDKVKAWKYLNASIENGWDDPVEIILNEDFAVLHQSENWIKSFGEIESKIEVDLRKQLLLIYQNDQAVLNAIATFDTKGQNQSTLDNLLQIRDSTLSVHTKFIIELFEKRGFVSKNVIGKKAAETQFLVIQHTENKEILIKYFPLLQKATELGDLDKKLFALFEDRVLVFQKKEQTYGSQLFWDKNNGKYYVFPIKNVENVDIRRIKVGLYPLIEYLSYYDIDWSLDYYYKNLPLSIEKLKE